ncbi:MAG: hypothetical protein FWC43_02970 [Planctomycetaceae bacterium]|nr:hypothetical protein [Planctomycetaceae bacterium]
MSLSPHSEKPVFLHVARWEIVALVLLFFVHGGWPVPDVNEAHYINKAIHFWNPDWITGDAFLDSKDAHWFFYATFGALSLLLPPTLLAWTGRLLAWFFLAIAWRRLSFVLIPVRYFSILTAAGMLYYLDAFSMSGEWIVGGVEGKSFAFPLMFLGLAAMLQGRWNRVWLYFGAASAFHVLVGGWAVVIGLFVLATESLIVAVKRKTFPSLSTFLFGFLFLFLGGLLSLPGLIPVLLLDYKTAPEIVSQAHYVYVYERLPHHLHPDGFPWTYKFRYAILTLLWAALSLVVSKKSHFPFFRLTAFVSGSLLLAGIGFFLAWIFQEDPKRASDFLRFYWFRTCDFAVPLGVSFAASMLLVQVFNHGTAYLAEKWKTRVDFHFVTKNLCGTLLVFGGFGVAVFLALNGLLFGFLFSSSLDGSGAVIPAEPAIPWSLTLLLGIGVLWSLEKSRKNVALAGWFLLLLVIVVWAPLGFYLKTAEQRVRPGYSRNDPVLVRSAYLWTDICNWINDPQNGIPQDAKFLTPGDSKNFKWNTRRSEVATWKDIPQDAAGIVKWYSTMEQLYTYRPKSGPVRRDYSLQLLFSRYTPERLEKLQEKYGYDYILCGKYPALDLPVVYANQGYEGYVIYKGQSEPRTER